MSNVLLHIPHASLEVPEEFYPGLTISRARFRRYNLEMCDIGIDELIRDLPGERVIAPFSRLYCDVERFRDDAKEPMSSRGEGVVYTHAYDGTAFHHHDDAYRNRVIAYYDGYHERLNDTAEQILSREGSLLIPGCHSFSDKMASHFFSPPFPDVCIGTDPDSVMTGWWRRSRRRSRSGDTPAGSTTPMRGASYQTPCCPAG